MPNINKTLIPDFGTFYKQYYKRASLFTQSYIHDELAAEDIASESLIKLWGILQKEHVKWVDTLLLTMLKNKALDYLRHEAIKEKAFDEMENIYKEELDLRISTLEACEPEEIFSAEVYQITQKTMKQLSKQTRLIFEMSRFENKSNKEIAHTLGLTVKSVEYHITKALKALRTNLKDYLPLFFLLLL